jgi:hypothetical protein
MPQFLLQSAGCQIPVADDPNAVAIPKRTPNTLVKKLSYITVDKQDKDPSPLFGGRQSWKQREESFKLNSTMKVATCLLYKCKPYMLPCKLGS